MNAIAQEIMDNLCLICERRPSVLHVHNNYRSEGMTWDEYMDNSTDPLLVGMRRQSFK